MAKQFQLRSRSISIDDLELAHTIQNGCEWYVEQQGHHQVHTREVIAFQLESITEYSGTHNPSLFGSLASDTWHIGTIIEDADSQFWRVQCKTGWLEEDGSVITFNTSSNHYHYKGGRTTNARRSYRGQVEYFAVYSPDLDKVYLIPVDHVGATQGMLRLQPTANNQRKGVKWAKDYEL
jgi:PD-(D/E)XK endonuclease